MVDYSNIPRDSRRVPLETRVQFKFDRFSGFLSEYSANVSPGGIFLRARAPQPPGTVLDFEFRLGDGFELIKGRGEVVWVRPEDEGPTRPAGMGIRFLELSPGSKELIYRIVDQHILQGGTPFDVTQRPPDSVPVVPVLPPRAAAVPPGPRPAPPPSEDVFDLAPAPAALRREPEPLPEASSWLPSIDDPALEPPPSRSPEPFPELFAAHAEPEPAPVSVPADAAPAPLFATTFGAASARPPRWVLPWALLAAGLVLAAALFLLRDRLMEMTGLGGGDETVQTVPPARPRGPGRTAPPAASATPGPVPAFEESPAPATPEATPEATPAPVAPRREAREPVPALAEDAEDAEAPDSGPAITQLQRITFEQTGGGTDVVLWGNGAIRPDSYTRSRLDGNPPRELFRLSGIRRQFSKARVVVGTPEVLQVRVGYHPEMGRGELHVVLDLARPNVAVTGVEPGEGRLRIHLQRE
ncbi:MAG TPA: TIGR02266 family protein [Thermoanaerobaculia bacterium]|jgi:uncharacterized protein (TIGR02266 family)|nr:TIGR02266 family protein [Thermoanaerobaculia bacterium]